MNKLNNKANKLRENLRDNNGKNNSRNNSRNNSPENVPNNKNNQSVLINKSITNNNNNNINKKNKSKPKKHTQIELTAEQKLHILGDLHNPEYQNMKQTKYKNFRKSEHNFTARKRYDELDKKYHHKFKVVKPTSPNNLNNPTRITSPKNHDKPLSPKSPKSRDRSFSPISPIENKIITDSK